MERPFRKLDGPAWLGANFWSRTGGPLMWRSYDPAVVRAELDVLRAHGLNLTRSFFYWPDFMPEPDRVDQTLCGHYADFLSSPLETVDAVYDALGLEWSSALEEKMAAALAAKPQGRHGEHSYSFDDLGVDRAAVAAGFARYVERFGVPTGG